MKEKETRQEFKPTLEELIDNQICRTLAQHKQFLATI